MTKKFIGKIDCEPTWESLLETLVLGVVNGTVNARAPYWGELRKMARAADAYRALQKAGKVP